MIADLHPMAIRYSLGGLLALGALNALGGGYYGLTGAVGVPTQWLEGSAFEDYFVPSLILLIAVGGSFMVAAIAVFAVYELPALPRSSPPSLSLAGNSADCYRRLRFQDAASDGHRRCSGPRAMRSNAGETGTAERCVKGQTSLSF